MNPMTTEGAIAVLKCLQKSSVTQIKELHIKVVKYTSSLIFKRKYAYIKYPNLRHHLVIKLRLFFLNLT